MSNSRLLRHTCSLRSHLPSPPHCFCLHLCVILLKLEWQRTWEPQKKNQVPLSEDVSLFLPVSVLQYHLRTLLVIAWFMRPCLGLISVAREPRPDHDCSHSFFQGPWSTTQKVERKSLISIPEKSYHHTF